MAKKIIYTTLIILFLISLALWSPWEEYDISFARIFGVKEIEHLSGLELFSLKGELELYLDDEYKGSITPEGGSFVLDDIEKGNHILRISRKSDNPNEYFEVVKSVNFVENLKVVLAYELGPSEEFSQGHIFYARKNSIANPDSTTAMLNINCQGCEEANVFLDEIEIGKTPVEGYQLDLGKVHNLKLEKQNYEDLEFTILPDSQEDRDKLKGIELFIDVNLFLIPIEIEQETVINNTE
ncbi:PEGA domain-containing protein [Candidatus Dojkabacteria bacterium]|nr:PEGA domain-containing protein [Candidatus Dojkabacteria bacterium]